MIVLQSLEVEEFDLEIQYECDGDCQEDCGHDGYCDAWFTGGL
ncbi:hypothetical protein ACP3C5_001993 [Enterococcus faecium]